MNLREAVRREVLDAGHEGFALGFGDGTQPRVKVDEHTDAAIAAMRDALLSDAAVESAIAGYNQVLPIREHIEEHLRQGWDGERTYDEESECMRAALTAALAALGVQEGEG